jgi:hypothetical protein
MKLLPVLFAFLLPLFVTAQNIAINNDNSTPDPTAILDIKSDSRGMLIPRLTTAQRNAILSPAHGLTIFNTETNSFWYWATDVGGGWLEMQTNLQKYWNFSAGNIYNTNNANVGIGTNTPAEKLSINGTDPVIQFLNAGSAKAFIQTGGNDIRLGTYFNNTTGDLYLNTRATDRMIITNTGLIGIGTLTPSTALTISATNPAIQMRNADVNKGFIQVSGDNMRMGTYLVNETGKLILETRNASRLLIDEDGQIGIGTAGPAATLTINGANPVIQLRNAEVDKGFIQINNNDIRIGTYTNNTTGRFIVRTSGADRVWVTENGQMGIGGIPSTDLMLSGHFPVMEFKHDNTVIGTLEVKQNAQVDLQLNTVTPLGRTILSANGTPFGVAVHPNHQVSIATFQKATGYQLSVGGKIMCTDLTMDNMNDWPDYVFEDKYKLLTLQELRAYINKYKHLPNIPSAAEIEKDGIQMGKITRGLMEKVEELTLYIFQLQEQITALKQITVSRIP